MSFGTTERLSKYTVHLAKKVCPCAATINAYIMYMMMMILVYLRSSLLDNYKDRSPGLHMRTLLRLGSTSHSYSSPKHSEKASLFTTTCPTITSFPLLPNHNLHSFPSPFLNLPLQFLGPRSIFPSLPDVLQHLLSHPLHLLYIYPS